MLTEALAILDEDERVNREASRRAAELVLRLCGRRPLRVLTHCNAGRLATVAWEQPWELCVTWPTPTKSSTCWPTRRGLCYRGSRLTAFELAEAGIPYRVCADAPPLPR